MKTLFYRKGENTLRARDEKGRFARAPRGFQPTDGIICVACKTFTVRFHGGPKIIYCAGCGRYFGALAEKAPPGACPRCGGWTKYGRMAQHSTTSTKVLGRRGCICHRKTRHEATL